jgi:hypothetical protein
MSYLSVHVDYLYSYIFLQICILHGKVTTHYREYRYHQVLYLEITERQSTDTFINTVMVFKGTVSTLFYGIGGPVLSSVHSLVQPIPERSTCSCQVNRRSYIARFVSVTWYVFTYSTHCTSNTDSTPSASSTSITGNEVLTVFLCIFM